MRAEAYLRGGEIATEIQHQSVEYDKALARRAPERIAEEIEVDRKGVKLAHKNLDFELEKMEAETRHLTAEYNMRQSQAEAERERAEFEKAKYRKARQELEGVSSTQSSDRDELLRKKVDLTTEIAMMEQQFSALLDDDNAGDEADAKRRGFEQLLETRRAELSAVLQELQG